MSLTRRALALVMLTVALAIVGLWSADAALGDLWRWPAALILVALAVEGALARRDDWGVTPVLPERAYLGRPTAIGFEVHTQHLPLEIELARAVPEGVVAAPGVERAVVAPGAPGVTRFTVTPVHLGELAWPPLPARRLGLFGLGWWSRRIALDTVLRVVPDVLHRSDRARPLALGGARARAARGAGSEVYELREYRDRDPLRSVDWKASARAQRLIARDFTEDQHLEVMLALDAGRTSGIRAGALDRLGASVNVLARLAEHVVSNDDYVGLVVFADQPMAAIAPMRGAAAVIRIRAALASLRPRSQETQLLPAAVRVRSLCRQRALVVIMSDLNDAGADSQLTRAVRLLAPKHLPLVAGIMSPELERLRGAHGERWIDPWVTLAAQEQLQRIRGSVAALRALGVPVVYAPAQHVERAVFSTYAELRLRRRI